MFRIDRGYPPVAGFLELQDEPYVMFRKKQTDDGVALVGNDRYHGFCAELAGRIATIVRFSYTLRIVGDGMYGAQQENGSWNGMIGELTRRVRMYS